MGYYAGNTIQDFSPWNRNIMLEIFSSFFLPELAFVLEIFVWTFFVCRIGNIVMVMSILEWGYYVVKINQYIIIIFWNGRYCNGNVCSNF